VSPLQCCKCRIPIFAEILRDLDFLLLRKNRREIHPSLFSILLYPVAKNLLCNVGMILLFYDKKNLRAKDFFLRKTQHDIATSNKKRNKIKQEIKIS